MCGCSNGHEAAVRALLESERVSAEQIRASNVVRTGRGV
jgi:hypothetical protein